MLFFGHIKTSTGCNRLALPWSYHAVPINKTYEVVLGLPCPGGSIMASSRGGFFCLLGGENCKQQNASIYSQNMPGKVTFTLHLYKYY